MATLLALVGGSLPAGVETATLSAWTRRWNSSKVLAPAEALPSDFLSIVRGSSWFQKSDADSAKRVFFEIQENVLGSANGPPGSSPVVNNPAPGSNCFIKSWLHLDLGRN